MKIGTAFYLDIRLLRVEISHLLFRETFGFLDNKENKEAANSSNATTPDK